MGGITVSTERVKCRALRVAIWPLAMIASTSVALPLHAQTPEQEPAITWTADDSGLQWGPCPAFLPKGCRIAVLHGDPAKANVDVFFKVPANERLPLHWHTSAERMVLVAGELRVTYEGQAPAILKPGTYAYGPSRRPHSGLCTSAVACVLFIAFESPVDAVRIESETN
jgi:quercetin dioxygenase-like cupin family protein